VPPDAFAVLGIASAEQCVDEFAPSRVSAEAASVGVDPDEVALETWFVAGCYPLAVLVQEAMAAEASATGELALGQPMLEALAEGLCQAPFVAATELGVEVGVLTDGVCFHLTFEPSADQGQSWMVPCE
jgi:hypothetical protein